MSIHLKTQDEKIKIYGKDLVDINNNYAYYHSDAHGYVLKNGCTIRIPVNKDCIIRFGSCVYSSGSVKATVNSNTTVVGSVAPSSVEAKVSNEGAALTFIYTGSQGTEEYIDFSFDNAYVHNIEILELEGTRQFSYSNGLYTVERDSAIGLYEALMCAQDGESIYIPEGTYNMGKIPNEGKLIVSQNNITIYGDGKDKTFIQGYLTTGYLWAALMYVTGSNVTIKDLSLTNIFLGPEDDFYKVSPALRHKGNDGLYYNCEFISYQDTIFSEGGSAYYYGCDVYGITDFVCNNAFQVDPSTGQYTNVPHADYFDKCNFYMMAIDTRDCCFAPQGVIAGKDCTINELLVEGFTKQSTRFFLARAWAENSVIHFTNTTLNTIPNYINSGYTEMSAGVYLGQGLVEGTLNGEPVSYEPYYTSTELNLILDLKSDPSLISTCYADYNNLVNVRLGTILGTYVPPTEPTIITWHLDGTIASGENEFTLTQPVEGSTLDFNGLNIDATSGKLAYASSGYTQFNSPATITIAAAGKVSNKLTVIFYPGQYTKTSINGVLATADTTTVTLDGAGTFTIKQESSTGYLYKIILESQD